MPVENTPFHSPPDPGSAWSAPTTDAPAGAWEAKVLDALGHAVVVTDPDGTIRSWNRFAEELYGWKAGEVLGKHILDVTPSPHTADEAADILARLRSGETWSGDFQVRRRDGTVFVAHVTDTPVFDDAGDLAGIVGISHDVTPDRRAEEDLRRRQEDLDDFFENAGVGLHWVADDGTILRANRAELEMLGYEAGEYVGRHIAEFHVDRAAIDEILERLGRGETLHDYEARMRCRDGSVRHVLITSNVRFENGRFLHTRCFTRDVTERYRAEQELRRLKREAEAASRAKSEFLAVISHELRTPLNAIMGYGDLLASEVAGPLTDTQQHHLQRIHASAQLLLELIDQILTLSRIEAGKETVDPHRVHLAALANDVASLVLPLAERKGLELQVHVEDDAGSVITDPVKLRQILLNLLSNAAKFTEAGGVALRVGREAATGAAVFEVRDTGPGIAREHLEAIFSPFTQLDQSRTRREGGTGLGLTVSRRFSALLGGDVTVESTPGQGSTFTVRIPARLPEEPGG